MKTKSKKSVMGPVISVFVMVLVISILAGLTFLFVSQLKTQVIDTTATTAGSVINESAWINSTEYTLDNSILVGFGGLTITSLLNATDGLDVGAANYTLTGSTLTNSTEVTWSAVNISYTYTHVGELTAYNAVNDTEAAGATVVNYLSLIFLAVIFGAILTLVLRIVLPYINLGQQMGGF